MSGNLQRPATITAAVHLFLGLLAGPPAAAREDWPMFRGAPDLRGVAAIERPAAEPRLLWTFPAAADGIQSSAAIAGGAVYVGAMDGTLHAISLEDGKERWSRKFEGAISASPLVRGDRVFIGDELGGFHALAAADGKTLWTFTAGAEIHGSANFDGDRILFASYDEHLYCLDAASGKVLWKFQTQGPVHAAPAVAAGKTFVCGCDAVFRVIEISSGKEVASFELDGQTAAAPAVLGSTAYIATLGGRISAVDWKEVKAVWSYSDPERPSEFRATCAALGDRVIAAGRDRAVRAFDAGSGKELWSFATRSRIDSSPVIAGKSIYVGAGDGNLYRLALADGRREWSFTTGAPISASPAIARGRLVISDEDGKVYCFLVSEESPEKKESR